MAAVGEEASGQAVPEPEGRTFDPDGLRRKYREERDKRLRPDRILEDRRSEGMLAGLELRK